MVNGKVTVFACELRRYLSGARWSVGPLARWPVGPYDRGPVDRKSGFGSGALNIGGGMGRLHCAVAFAAAGTAIAKCKMQMRVAII